MFDLQPIPLSIIRMRPNQRFLATVALLLLLGLLTPVIPASAAISTIADSRNAAHAQPVEQSVSCGASAYRVRPGDTLGAIARRFDTTSGAIRQCNRLSSSVVAVGQVLSIPGVANNSVATPKARVTRSYRSSPSSSSSSGGTYNPYYRERRPTPVPRR